MRWSFALLFLLLLTSALALDVPQPQGHVNDYANILTAEQRASLEQQLRALEENTTVEIAILTIPSLEGEDRELYANRVFRQWGIGKSDVNNGILILVALEDRKMRIEVGYGLEPIVTDTVSGLIIRNRMTPAFRQGDYYAGLQGAVNDLAGLVRGDPSAVSQYRHNGIGVPPGQLAAALLLSFCYLCLVISTARKRGKWKGYGFGTAVLIAFLIGATAGWLTLFMCFWILMLSMGGGFLFLPGGGFGGGSGGFGGFGGGMSGGGGAGGDW